MKARLIVGLPMIILPLAMVMTWQTTRSVQQLVPLAVTYLACLVVALVYDRAEKAGNR